MLTTSNSLCHVIRTDSSWFCFWGKCKYVSQTVILLYCAQIHYWRKSRNKIGIVGGQIVRQPPWPHDCLHGEKEAGPRWAQCPHEPFSQKQSFSSWWQKRQPEVSHGRSTPCRDAGLRMEGAKWEVTQMAPGSTEEPRCQPTGNGALRPSTAPT